MKMKTYSELISIPDFKERYFYLKLDGNVAEETFGWDRKLNQIFYNSKEWKDFRRDIILRDNGCDLAFEDYYIMDKILIHHLNPITKEDILHRRLDIILNPENVVCVSKRTHNAIHYGDERLIFTNTIVSRRPNDTIPWKGGTY